MCVCADAVERLREFTESPDAWSVAYETMLDADLSRVPHCTEQFMTLISEITGGGGWAGPGWWAGRWVWGGVGGFYQELTYYIPVSTKVLHLYSQLT